MSSPQRTDGPPDKRGRSLDELDGGHARLSPLNEDDEGSNDDRGYDRGRSPPRDSNTLYANNNNNNNNNNSNRSRGRRALSTDSYDTISRLALAVSQPTPADQDYARAIPLNTSHDGISASSSSNSTQPWASAHDHTATANNNRQYGSRLGGLRSPSRTSPGSPQLSPHASPGRSPARSPARSPVRSPVRSPTRGWSPSLETQMEDGSPSTLYSSNNSPRSIAAGRRSQPRSPGRSLTLPPSPSSAKIPDYSQSDHIARRVPPLMLGQQKGRSETTSFEAFNLGLSTGGGSGSGSPGGTAGKYRGLRLDTGLANSPHSPLKNIPEQGESSPCAPTPRTSRMSHASMRQRRRAKRSRSFAMFNAEEADDFEASTDFMKRLASAVDSGDDSGDIPTTPSHRRLPMLNNLPSGSVQHIAGHPLAAVVVNPSDSVPQRGRRRSEAHLQLMTTSSPQLLAPTTGLGIVRGGGLVIDETSPRIRSVGNSPHKGTRTSSGDSVGSPTVSGMLYHKPGKGKGSAEHLSPMMAGRDRRSSHELLLAKSSQSAREEQRRAESGGLAGRRGDGSAGAHTSPLLTLPKLKTPEATPALVIGLALAVASAFLACVSLIVEQADFQAFSFNLFLSAAVAMLCQILNSKFSVGQMPLFSIVLLMCRLSTYLGSFYMPFDFASDSFETSLSVLSAVSEAVALVAVHDLVPIVSGRAPNQATQLLGAHSLLRQLGIDLPPLYELLGLAVDGGSGGTADGGPSVVGARRSKGKSSSSSVKSEKSGGSGSDASRTLAEAAERLEQSGRLSKRGHGRNDSAGSASYLDIDSGHTSGGSDKPQRTLSTDSVGSASSVRERRKHLRRRSMGRLTRLQQQQNSPKLLTRTSPAIPQTSNPPSRDSSNETLSGDRRSGFGGSESVILDNTSPAMLGGRRSRGGSSVGGGSSAEVSPRRPLIGGGDDGDGHQHRNQEDGKERERVGGQRASQWSPANLARDEEFLSLAVPLAALVVVHVISFVCVMVVPAWAVGDVTHGPVVLVCFLVVARAFLLVYTEDKTVYLAVQAVRASVHVVLQGAVMLSLLNPTGPFRIDAASDILAVVAIFYTTRSNIAEFLTSLSATASEYTAQLESLTCQRAAAAEAAAKAAAAAEKAKSHAGFTRSLGSALSDHVSNALSLSGKLMEDPTISPAMVGNIETLEGYLQDLLGSLGDLKTFLSVQEGDVILEVLPLNLPAICEDVATGVIRDSSPVELVWDVGDDVPIGMVGDAERLRQILFTVVRKVMSYTEQGEVVVTVSLEGTEVVRSLPHVPHSLTATARSGVSGVSGLSTARTILSSGNDSPTSPDSPALGYIDMATIKIEVRSTGSMPVASVRNMLHPFATPARELGAHKSGSLRLALPMCRLLLEQMGGSLEASALEDGVGSVLTARAQLRVLSDSTHVRERRSDRAVRGSIAGLRILVVDDHPTARRVVCRLLTNHFACTTHEFGSGKDALNFARLSSRSRRRRSSHSDVAGGLPPDSNVSARAWMSQRSQRSGSVSSTGGGDHAHSKSNEESGSEADKDSPQLKSRRTPHSLTQSGGDRSGGSGGGGGGGSGSTRSGTEDEASNRDDDRSGSGLTGTTNTTQDGSGAEGEGGGGGGGGGGHSGSGGPVSGGVGSTGSGSGSGSARKRASSANAKPVSPAGLARKLSASGGSSGGGGSGGSGGSNPSDRSPSPASPASPLSPASQRSVSPLAAASGGSPRRQRRRSRSRRGSLSKPAGPPIDMALIDLDMVGTDGLTLSRELHEIAPNLPVVLMCSPAQRHSLGSEELREIAGVITKPITKTRLGATVQAAKHIHVDSARTPTGPAAPAHSSGGGSGVGGASTHRSMGSRLGGASARSVGSSVAGGGGGSGAGDDAAGRDGGGDGGSGNTNPSGGSTANGGGGGGGGGGMAGSDGGYDSESSLSSPRKPRALIVEDNPVNLRIAVAVLAKHGFETVAAENGRIAVDKFVDDLMGFDVIIMDMHMPVMDGLEATLLIRKHEADFDLQPTPILALTGDVTPGYRTTCMEAGCTEYVPKPIDYPNLIRIVNMLMEDVEFDSEEM